MSVAVKSDTDFANHTGDGGLYLGLDDRGGYPPHSKPTLSLTDAGRQLTRTGLSWSSALGTAANVTFAFRSAAPASMPDGTGGFTRFTETQITATLLALQAWSDVADITFSRVADADGFSDNASILFGDYSTGAAGAAAFAYFPGSTASGSIAGDVWVNRTQSSNIAPALLNYGQHTLIHEIGHALGLSHPSTYDAAAGTALSYTSHAGYNEDSRQYTVMSYFSESSTGGSFRSPASFANLYPSAPMLDDVAAAQRLYGANMTTRTGDTIYGFNSNADRPWFTTRGGTNGEAQNSLIFAVWDAGGTDTFDFSGYTQSQVIDLRQGSFSNVGGLIGNVAIALGTVIENARGGLGADQLIGSSANNVLTGFYGNDVIDGGLGVDTAYFLSYRAEYTITVSGQTVTVRHVAEGTDTITNVEFLRFADQTLAIGPNGDVVTTGGLMVNGDVTDDIMNGTAFADSLSGSGGADTISGFAGNDSLNGGSGNDVLSGGDGDDTLYGGDGDDRLDGGAGFDVADYNGTRGGVTVNLANGTATGASGTDILISIEGVRGTAYSDILRGDANDNILRGNGGVDFLYGGGGNDSFYSDAFFGAAPLGTELDILKTQAITNSSRATAVSLDGGFGQSNRLDVDRAFAVPNATVVATSSGNAEWYSFTASARAEVVIDIDFAMFDSVVRVYDSAGTLIASNDDGTTTGSNGDLGYDTDSAVAFVSPANGVYYVEVSEWESNTPNLTSHAIANGATYTLHVSVGGHEMATGSAATTSMFGEAGDDNFYLLNRDNARIDGGDGIDTAVFTGNYSSFTFTTANGVSVINGAAVGQGVYTLSNVEFVQFGGASGQRFALAPDGPTLIGTANGETLYGSPGNDRINGLGGNDTLIGALGDDILTGGLGSDLLDGGAGIDTAAYAGIRRQYGTANSSTVVGGPEGGADSLTSIENARFVDGTLTFDVDSASAQVMRLYDAALGRQYDPAGLEGQSAWIRNGTITLRTLADAFVHSAEFLDRFGALDNRTFIEQLYRFSLGRDGEPEGVNGWTASLNAGMSRGDVVIGFSESAEHRGLTQSVLNQGLWIADAQALTIARLYDATFDRLPEAEGLIGWTASLKAGMALSQIASGFSDSPEFQARYGALSNHDFVAQLFRFCLNREGDAAGIQNWVNNIDAGLRTRAQVLLEFSESQEHINLTTPNMLGGIKTVDYQSVPSFADDAVAKGASDPVTLPELIDDGSVHDAPALTSLKAKAGPLTLPQTSDEALIVPTLSDDNAFILAFDADQTPLVLPAQEDPASTSDLDAVSIFGGRGDIALTLLPNDATDWASDPAAWTHLNDTGHLILH